MGKRTIKDGEAAVIWDRYGRHRQVIGPSLEYMFSSYIRFLDRFTAEIGQYIEVKYCDGKQENILGPKTMFLNPVIHRTMQVRDTVRLISSDHVLVLELANLGMESDSVSSESSSFVDFDKVQDTATVVAEEPRCQYKLVHGPCSYVPRRDEKPVKLNWDSQDGVIFTGAQTCSKEYALRTSDGITCSVQVSVAYDIDDLQRLLAVTLTPMDDLSRAIATDLAEIAHTLSSLQLLEDGVLHEKLFCRVEDFMTGDDFKQTKSCVTERGISIHMLRVVEFKGLENAFESQLRKKMQAQESLAAAQVSDQLSKQRLHHEASQCEAEGKMKGMRVREELQIEKLRAENAIEIRKKWNEQQLDFLKNLTTLEVNLTEVLSKPGLLREFVQIHNE